MSLFKVLHEQDILDTDEGKSLLYLLRKLAKSAQVFPQCYELKGVQCDFSRPQEGGGFADIFKGEYENQTICVKAVRIFREQDNAQMLRVGYSLPGVHFGRELLTVATGTCQRARLMGSPFTSEYIAILWCFFIW